MKLFAPIQQFAGRLILKQQLKNFSRTLKFYNLDMAKSVGIIYSYKNEEEFRIVEQLIKQLHDEKKQVKVLVCIQDVRMLEFIPQRLTMDYIRPNEVDWFYRPNSTYVKDFIKTRFHILLDLNYGESFPLEYVLAFSKAYYKVGVFDEEKKKSLDLMIKISPEKGIIYIIREMIRYLKIIDSYENE